MRRLLPFLLACCLLSACISRPDNVLDEDAMTGILIDVHMAEALLDLQREEARSSAPMTDAYQQELIAAVLSRHGVSKFDYDSSLVWYSKNLKLLIQVYDRVQDSLSARHEWWLAQAQSIREFEVSAPGDSVELWTIARYLLLPGQAPHHHRVWTIPTDSNYQKGDTLRWSFDTHQLGHRQLIATVALTMSQADSSWQTSHTAVIRADQHCELVASGDTSTAIDQVTLTAFLLPLDSRDTTLRRQPLLLDGLSLMRYHRR